MRGWGGSPWPLPQVDAPPPDGPHYLLAVTDMAERTQKQKQAPARSEEEVVDAPASTATGEKLKAELERRGIKATDDLIP